MAATKYDDAVTGYTPKQLKQHHDDALTEYINMGGEVSVKVLSRTGKVPQSYIRKWMKEEKWDKYVHEESGDKVKITQETKDFITQAKEKFGVTDQEELFCYHYLKTLNATTAAIRAGYPPTRSYTRGWDMLKQERVQGFIRAIKSQMCEELFIDQMDVLRMWARIAFADMNEFVSVSGAGVRLRNSNSTDGQIITKIKEGRDGVSVELADRMKALDRLSSYFQILPGDKAQHAKLQVLQKALSGDGDETPLRIEIVGV